MKPLMAAAVALTLAGAAVAQEPPAAPAQVPAGVTLTPVHAETGLTRDDVLHDLQFARAAGTVTPAGEIGDTREVLAAREAYHAGLRAALLAGDAADRDVALEVATETAVGLSNADAIADADVYEMTDEDGGLVGYLFVVEDEAPEGSD